MEEEEVAVNERLEELLHEETFWEKWERIQDGLKADPESGEYKWARSEFNRTVVPAAISFTMVTLVMTMLILFVSFGMNEEEPLVEMTMVEPEDVEMPEEEIEPPEPEEIEPVDVEPTDVVAEVVTEVFTPDVMENNPTTDTSVKPVDVTAVMNVKSPMVMKNLFGNRNPGQRGQALAKYGGGGPTEDAVLRALRWLKKVQNADGSWNMGGPEAAMTGLALMCFLAHGETPQSSEFGHTVEQAIKYLVSIQNADGNFQKTGSHHSYGNAIANYALCEAYAMTRIVALKDVCERGIKVIVDGQQASGGWDYNYNQGSRADVSVMSWQAQALKAAYMAGVPAEGLDEALAKAPAGFKMQQGGKGGFGYTSPGDTELAGAAVLSLQLLGDGASPEARKGLEYMYPWKMDWADPGAGGVKKNPLYHWYYITQAKFQEGGGMWTAWNGVMKPSLIAAQATDGHWEHPKAHEDSLVYSTTLSCLMLEVYYRHLPTFAVKTEGAGDVPEAGNKDIKADDANEIKVEIL